MCSPILPNEWRRPDITDRFPGCMPQRLPERPASELPGCIPGPLPEGPTRFPGTDCWPDDIVQVDEFEEKIQQGREEWLDALDDMPGPPDRFKRIPQEPHPCFGTAALDIVA